LRLPILFTAETPAGGKALCDARIIWHEDRIGQHGYHFGRGLTARHLTPQHGEH
jgi:hypothetical protein